MLAGFALLGLLLLEPTALVLLALLLAIVPDELNSLILVERLLEIIVVELFPEVFLLEVLVELVVVDPVKVILLEPVAELVTAPGVLEVVLFAAPVVPVPSVQAHAADTGCHAIACRHRTSTSSYRTTPPVVSPVQP